MKELFVKTAKVGVSNGNGTPVWCERCCIRIAPSEQRTVHSGKSYHTRCYLKVRPIAKTK